jgi:dUTP pyrophosphatase
MKVKIKVIDGRLKEFGIPAYATDGSAGLDCRAMFELGSELIVQPNQTVLIPTGFSLEIPTNEVAAILIPKSGLGHKSGIVLGNLVGLIASDCRGQVFVSCWNRSNSAYTIQLGERLAQMVFLPVIKVELETEDELTTTARDSGGFGHSGTL